MWCSKRCSHGGVCELESGHEGLHDTRYCTYTDAEALSDDEGDSLFMANSENPVRDALIVAMTAPSE